MKLPGVEVSESLGLQDHVDKPGEESKILWAYHCQGHMVAGSYGTNVVIFLSNSRKSESDQPSTPVLSRLTAVHINAGPHRITAMCWFCNVVPQIRTDEGDLDVLTTHLLLGNERGEFMVYDIIGDLIVRQRLHSSAILQIHTRPASIGLERESLEDISIVFHDLICCLSLPELLAFIRLHEVGSGQSQDPSLKLTFGKFSYGKSFANRTDGIDLGISTPSLKSFLKKPEKESEDAKISILSVGRSPAVGTFEATLHPSKSGALAMIGKFASSITTGLTSMAWKQRRPSKGNIRSWWSSPSEDDHHRSPVEKTTLAFSLRDSKRHVLNLLPSPKDSLAVACDNLGRVLLMDTQKSVILRIWKGYRDAQCGWITHPETHRLFLVIYGWRRETLEVWPMRYGPRFYSRAIGPKCRLLSSTPPMGLGDDAEWTLKCAVLDNENEEIWDVGQVAFSSHPSESLTVWDMMLTNTSI